MSILREAVETISLKTFSVSRIGNGLDSIPWKVIEQIFRTYFGKGGYTICVCNGEVQTPPEADRHKIIQECHDSAVGGHKGETKFSIEFANDFTGRVCGKKLANTSVRAIRVRERN